MPKKSQLNVKEFQLPVLMFWSYFCFLSWTSTDLEKVVLLFFFFWIGAKAWHWQGKGLSNVLVSKWCQLEWLWNWEAMSTIKHALANWQACIQNQSEYSKRHKSMTSNDHLLATAEFLPVLVFPPVHENNRSLPIAVDFQMKRWAKQKLFWGSSHSFSEILVTMFKT